MDWLDPVLTVALDGTSHEISLVVLVAFVVSFAAFLVLLHAIMRRLRSPMAPGCQWRRVRDGDRARFRKWQCAVCAAEAFATGRRPPIDCKRLLRSGL